MRKVTLLLSTILCLTLNAKDNKKMEQESSMKIVQVEILVDTDSKVLKSLINQFLIDKKIQRENLLDIKFHVSDYKRALLIYEVNYQEK
jgi:hypothetical protein